MRHWRSFWLRTEFLRKTIRASCVIPELLDFPLWIPHHCRETGRWCRRPRFSDICGLMPANMRSHKKERKKYRTAEWALISSARSASFTADGAKLWLWERSYCQRLVAPYGNERRRRTLVWISDALLFRGCDIYHPSRGRAIIARGCFLLFRLRSTAIERYSLR